MASLAAGRRNADGQLADLHMAARAEAEDVNRVIAHLTLDDSLVVVGDLERIRADVESAPGTWTELDASGIPCHESTSPQSADAADVVFHRERAPTPTSLHGSSARQRARRATWSHIRDRR